VDLLDRDLLCETVMSGADALFTLPPPTSMNARHRGVCCDIAELRILWLHWRDAFHSTMDLHIVATRVPDRLTPQNARTSSRALCRGEQGPTEQIVRSALVRVASGAWHALRHLGPGMNDHYLNSRISATAGIVTWGADRPQVYGYVVTLYSIHPPPEDQRTRSPACFFLADYQPIALEAWADAFQVALGARQSARFREPGSGRRVLGDRLIPRCQKLPFNAFD